MCTSSLTSNRSDKVHPLKSGLEQACINAFAECGLEADLGVLQLSDRPDLADFQCNGALAAAKAARRNPRDLAAGILQKLSGDPNFTVSIAGPGFLNFRLSDAALSARAELLRDSPTACLFTPSKPLGILLDYGGPNIAKEMHVGHLRSSLIGQALKNILAFGGHRVVSDIHLGDWGLQMGQLICYIEDEVPNLLAEDDETKITMSDLQLWYPQASERSKADDGFRNRARTATQQLQARHASYFRLWERICAVSIEGLKRDFGWLGVDFDFWFGESRYQAALSKLVADAESRGVAMQSDGAIIIPMPEPDTLPPLILRNSNGGFGYGATDIATLVERVGLPDVDTVLYVVDARQSMHFQQVFNGADSLGLLDKVTVEHVAFGTVNGNDGKPFKTREGGTMRLIDLIEMMTQQARARLDEADRLDPDLRGIVAEQVARAAIKFGELSHDRERNYIFDMDQFLKFEGKTGPYLQYTAVRIRSLIASAVAEAISMGPVVDLGQLGRDLVIALDAMPSAILRSITTRKPSHLANHLYRVADCTNKFYQQNRLLHESTPAASAASWLSLLSAADQQLAVCMDILGIEIPEKM